MEWKVGSLLEKRHLNADSFMEHLQRDFYSLFEANYDLENQLRDFLERHWK